MDRYARQSVFSKIGTEGQEKLLASRVTIIGMGALGTVAANNLCRAGIGFIRMADRDYVELTNLQRQTLFSEDDAAQSLPKVIAAYNHLSKVNSEITIEPVITDVNPSNVENLIDGADLVLDATDNFDIRLLVNEACHKHRIPWIYCGALGSGGMTMNILPDRGGPCLRCFISEPNASPTQSCSTVGVLNMATGIMASLQTAEALKILLGSDAIRQELLMMDLWGNYFQKVDLKKDEDCPVCVHGQYSLLGQVAGAYTTSICGTDSVQVVPPNPMTVDFPTLSARLQKAGAVRYTPYVLTFHDGKYEIMLFQDGRAIIKNAIDGNNARSVYTEYIGM